MARLRLPAQVGNLPAFRAMVMEEAEGRLTPEQSFGLDVILEELVANVASYAYGPEGGDLEIVCGESGPAGSEERVFRVVFRDWGPPFNPLEAEGPDMDADDAARAQGGFGIHLVVHKADSVGYTRNSGVNETIIGFSLADAPARTHEGSPDEAGAAGPPVRKNPFLSLLMRLFGRG